MLFSATRPRRARRIGKYLACDPLRDVMLIVHTSPMLARYLAVLTHLPLSSASTALRGGCLPRSRAGSVAQFRRDYILRDDLQNHLAMLPRHRLYMLVRRDGTYVCGCCSSENSTLVFHPYSQIDQGTHSGRQGSRDSILDHIRKCAACLDELNALPNASLRKDRSRVLRIASTRRCRRQIANRQLLARKRSNEKEETGFGE